MPRPPYTLILWTHYLSWNTLFLYLFKFNLPFKDLHNFCLVPEVSSGPEKEQIFWSGKVIDLQVNDVGSYCSAFTYKPRVFEQAGSSLGRKLVSGNIHHIRLCQRLDKSSWIKCLKQCSEIISFLLPHATPISFLFLQLLFLCECHYVIVHIRLLCVIIMCVCVSEARPTVYLGFLADFWNVPKPRT